MTAATPEYLAETLDTNWKRYAACGGYDTDRFYGRDSEESKGICGGCPVRSMCLDYALLTNQYGIWGGMTERERDKRFSEDFREAMREDYDY